MLYHVCYVYCVCVFFFFKPKTAYEMRISDCSSDVCSSDLRLSRGLGTPRYPLAPARSNRRTPSAGDLCRPPLQFLERPLVDTAVDRASSRPLRLGARQEATRMFGAAHLRGR